MFVIQKFTQNYDKTEDRIALACQNSAKEVVRLWLTQRLLLRLIEALIKCLNDEMKSVTNGRFAQDMHGFEQSAALSGLKPQTAVESDMPKENVLVISIDLTTTPKGYRVIFRWGTDSAAGLVFDSIKLRQFLGILHHLFGEAGWSRHTWPAWFSNELAPADLAEPSILH